MKSYSIVSCLGVFRGGLNKDPFDKYRNLWYNKDRKLKEGNKMIILRKQCGQGIERVEDFDGRLETLQDEVGGTIEELILGESSGDLIKVIHRANSDILGLPLNMFKMDEDGADTFINGSLNGTVLFVRETEDVEFGGRKLTSLNGEDIVYIQDNLTYTEVAGDVSTYGFVPLEDRECK